APKASWVRWNPLPRARRSPRRPPAYDWGRTLPAPPSAPPRTPRRWRRRSASFAAAGSSWGSTPSAQSTRSTSSAMNSRLSANAGVAARFKVVLAWTPGGGIDAVSLDAYATDTLTGKVDACVETLSRFAQHGVEELIVSAATLPFAISDWSMVELIAEQLIPA